MKDLIQSITKQEWKFWAKILIAVLILTSVSRIFAVVLTPEGQVWTGRTYFPPVDRFVYISYVEQIKNGANILQDFYSAKGETAPMINVFWMFLGYAARFTGLSSFAVIELSRVFFMPGLFFILYILISYFFKNILERKTAFLLAVFGGGLGVWAYPIIAVLTRGKELIDHLPIDFNVTEAFIFLSSYYSAHYIVSLSLFFFLILAGLIAVERKKIHYAIYAGLAGLILINFHPFSFTVFIYIFAAYFFYLLWKDKTAAFFLFKYFLIFTAIVLPAAIYHLQMMQTPWWQNQTWNSNTETPNFIYIFFGYGLLLLLAIMSIYKICKKELEISSAPFLVIWFFGQISLIFLPISVQRRFLEGYDVLLAILAAPYIAFAIKKKAWLIKGKFFSALIFVVLFSLSFIVVIYLDFCNYIYRIPLIYAPKDSFEAMRALRDYTGADDLILADLYSANTIPGVALRHVFVGHGTETINYMYKLNILTRFGKSNDENERWLILQNNKIDYLFYDPSWNWGFNPDDDDFLKKMFDIDGYKLYKVL